MSAVQGVPVTAQAGGSSVVLPADQNGTSGVNAASISMHEAMTVQQVSNPPVATLQKQQNHNSPNRSKSQNSVKNNDNSAAGQAAGGMCDEKTVEYLRDLIEERKTIENNNIEEIQEIGGNASGNSVATSGPKSIVLRLLDQGEPMVLNRAQAADQISWGNGKVENGMMLLLLARKWLFLSASDVTNVSV
jgi:hypothetical protein